MARKSSNTSLSAEDKHWAEEGRKALEEFKRSGKKTIPWEKVRERLGLGQKRRKKRT